MRWGIDYKKIGRPTNSIKDSMIRVRMDKETVEKLDVCVKFHRSNRSEIIRKGIEVAYNDLEEK